MRSTTAEPRIRRRPSSALLSLLVAGCGVLAALALPFAPVISDRVILTWPVSGEPAASTTAVLAPYRPSELTARIPCSALRPTPTRVTVLATAPEGEGLAVVTGRDGAVVAVDGSSHRVSPRLDDPACSVTVHGGRDHLTIADARGDTARIEGPVPKVFGFRTDLQPADAAGMTVTAEIDSPFGTSPTTMKCLLVAAQLVCAAAALFLLRGGRRRRRRWHPKLWWIDAAVIAVLACWAVIGPLAVDDGWATMIARNFAATGEVGNYYRWWNAAEVPFALSQQLLSRLTEVSLAPLWLRLPSTLLAIATWLVLSRGVLGAAIPAVAATARIRLLAAVLLLAAWLPFNLGVRPESYVAFAATTVLALVWRARSPRTVGWAVLAAALTVPISPTGLLAVAPLVVFAPRLIRNSPLSRLNFAATVGLLSCVAAVGVTAIFADQNWSALITATDWHTFFGPSLPWYDEPQRYEYLLGDDQQGSAAKRLPILLTAAMLPMVALLTWHRRPWTVVERSVLRHAAVLLLGVAVFAAVPSKWSYHLGAAAGLVASFLTVSAVLTWTRIRSEAPRRPVIVAGAILLCCAAAYAFAGPNAWWLTTVYDVPLQAGPIRPKGLPLDNPLLWAAVAVLGCGVYGLASRTRPSRAILSAPTVLTVGAAATSVAVLLASFVIAPIRRPTGSLAVANLHQLSGERSCGLADDIEVLPDGSGTWVGLDEFLADNGPVLMSWPTSFVLPCVRNIVEVSDGLAQTPGVVIEPPRPYFSEDRDPSIGGTFAAVAEFVELHEVPSRMVGHPDVDWGTVLVAPAGPRRDAYERSITHERRWGFDDAGRARPER